MNKSDLLIFDIGRSFLFVSHLRYKPNIGYGKRAQYFSRINQDIEIDELIDAFLPKMGLDDSEPKIMVSTSRSKNIESRKHSLDIVKSDWRDNLKYFNTERQEKYGYLTLQNEEMFLANEDNVFHLELSLVDEILKLYSLQLAKLGITQEKLANYFFHHSPLPQHVMDYQLSYALGYFAGKTIAQLFDFQEINFLIVDCEWLKCGFLDQSAFMQGLSEDNYHLRRYSFDTNNVWRFMINDRFNSFSELMYINREMLNEELFLLEDIQGKLSIKTETEFKQIYILGNKQNYFDLGEEFVITGHEIEIMSGKFFIQVTSKNHGWFMNLDFFKTWYQFYKYKVYEFIGINFNEKFTHRIIIGNKHLENISKAEIPARRVIMFKDALNSKYNIAVSKGESIEKGDVIAKMEKWAGIMYKEIKSDIAGIVEYVDKPNQYLIVRSNKKEKIENAFNYEYLSKEGLKKSLIEIHGIKLPVYTNLGKSKLVVLNSLEDKINMNMPNGYFVNNIDEFNRLMQDFNHFQPQLILLSSIAYANLKTITDLTTKMKDFLSIAVVNGLGEIHYSEFQKKLFKLNTGKFIYLDSEELAVYVLEKEGKFSSLKAPYSERRYSKIYTFDDWNLEGNIIYNDEDSMVFKSTNGRVIDTAKFNIIKYNNEGS